MNTIQKQDMADSKNFDVIIVGGSYSGLAAAMALGRALRKVLIIDSEKPCNRQTPHSHNFLTQDGNTPREISALARKQVSAYSTVKFFNGLASSVSKTEIGFDVQTLSGERFSSTKLIFATGIEDIIPDIKGFDECWGTSVLHCPYCHGYEVKNEATGILGNGELGFELAKLISNWTTDLKLFTNSTSTLTAEQTAKLKEHGIKLIENEVKEMEHINGKLQNIVFKDGLRTKVTALYARPSFKQHSTLPEQLGCELTDEGYVRVDVFQKTNVKGVYVCGDNSSRMRTVANAIATGTTTGMMVNKELIEENFK